jgi:hypothetical protein
MNIMDTGNNIGSQQHPPKKPISSGIIGFVGFSVFVGWALSVSTNGVFNFFSDSPAFQLYPFCFALWCGVILSSYRLVVLHNKHPSMFMVAAAFCVVVFVVTVKAVARKQPQLSSSVVKSVAQRFDSDFQRMLTSENTMTYSHFTNTIRFKLCIDFESKSEIAAAYISRSPYTYGICTSLVVEIPKLISNIQATTKISGGYVWDTSAITWTNLVFTGAVFIYCDDSLPIEQAGDLNRIYQRYGFTLQLRDGRYADLRNVIENK